MSLITYYNISIKRDTFNKNFERPKSSELIVMGSLLLIGGWLADAYFGRYRVICCGLWMMWLGSLLSVFSLIISKLYSAYVNGDRYVSIFSKLVMGFGFGLFQSNIIQFGVDQLSDSSSTEITSFITCYILTFFAGGAMLYYGTICTPDYVHVLVLTASLSLALCTLFLFNHVLVKEQIVQNPLPLILKVAHYAIRNKHLQRRIPSFKDSGCLSRLDVAKMMYSGPFRSDQVEDVKTFFRALGVIASCTLAYTGVASISTVEDRMLPHFLDWPNASISLSNCYTAYSIKHVGFILPFVVVLLYLIVIQPIFYKCIPTFSIMSRFIIALILLFISIVAILGVESASYYYQLAANASNIDRCYILQNDRSVVNLYNYWIIIPRMLSGFSLFIMLVAAMEFVCAQVPFNMKGLVFGISYMLFGFGTLIHAVLSFPFVYVKETSWKKAPLTCGIWYFIIQAFIVVVGFVVMVIVIRKYKNRTRIDVIHSDWQESDD